MKGSKILGSLAAASILAQLLIMLAATPALAASVTVSPPSGPAGKTIIVSGAGFTANNPYIIVFAYGTPFSQGFGRGIVSNGGDVPATSFTVPKIPGGAYAIRVETFGPTGEHVSRTFLIIPEIDLDQSYGYVGSQATVDGTGFAAGKTVSIYFDDEEVGTTETDENGSFTDAPFAVPDSFRGTHTVRAVDGENNYATDSFSTRESMTITPTSGAVGHEVTLNGTGFKSSKLISITFDGDAVSAISGALSSNDQGSFSGAFAVPLRYNGNYEVTASDGTNQARASFAVLSGVSLSPATGTAGTKVTLAGSGFTGPVTVKYDDQVVATAFADSRGEFSASFDAPPSSPGGHTIIASDGSNTTAFTFTMQSEVIPAPVLLLPEADTETEATAYFDWEDVEAVSPAVTYGLQVASDKDFASIVLEKKGLDSSEYTVTEEEKLEPGRKDVPHYWRVRAVDGFANVSAWSSPRAFYVSSGFAFPGWGLYLLIGLGVLVLVLFGFWIGRRTAYNYG